MASLAFEKSTPYEHWLDEGDLSQIRDMLALTPEERLRSIQESLNSAIELRNVLLKREEVSVDFFASLEVLARHQVEFIIVDDVAAVLVGTPIMSRDLDVLYRATTENKARILSALRELDALCADGADTANLSTAPEVDRYSWITRFSPIHTRDRIGGETYSSLIGLSDQHRIAGHLVCALNLAAQTSIREKSQRLLDEYFLLFLWNISRVKNGSDLMPPRRGSESTAFVG